RLRSIAIALRNRRRFIAKHGAFSSLEVVCIPGHSRKDASAKGRERREGGTLGLLTLGRWQVKAYPGSPNWTRLVNCLDPLKTSMWSKRPIASIIARQRSEFG